MKNKDELSAIKKRRKAEKEYNEKLMRGDDDDDLTAEIPKAFIIASIEVVEIKPPTKEGFCDFGCGFIRTNGLGHKYCRWGLDTKGDVCYEDGVKSYIHCAHDKKRCPGEGRYECKMELWKYRGGAD